MLINKTSQTTGLTKKAIEYYSSQGLISPSILANGYRNYSENDIELLHKISVLRKLDLSINEIKTILSDQSNTALQVISVQKELNSQRETAKKEILNALSCGKPYFEISIMLDSIDNSKTITDKLLEAFPGYYGRFICLHFARFLNEPIKTESQQSAYKTIISFLDSAPPLNMPEDLHEYLIECTKHIGTEQITQMIGNTRKYIENVDDFLSTNKETLDEYLAYKQSDEYKNSPACKIMEVMMEFNSASGYNDIFIPALKVLSNSYLEYYQRLEMANIKFLTQYPEIENLNSQS